MVNSEWTGTSAVPGNSNNWLSTTGQSIYVLNEKYQAIELFGLAEYIKIDSL